MTEKQELLKKLSKEKKHLYLIYKDESISKDYCVNVQIDGVNFKYPVGKEIEVPETIYNLLKKRYSGIDLKKPEDIVL